MQVASPELTLDIDRDRASALGVNAGQVENALYSAFGARQVSTIFKPNNDYQVILELLPEYQRNPDSLNMLYMRSTLPASWCRLRRHHFATRSVP